MYCDAYQQSLLWVVYLVYFFGNWEAHALDSCTSDVRTLQSQPGQHPDIHSSLVEPPLPFILPASPISMSSLNCHQAQSTPSDFARHKQPPDFGLLHGSYGTWVLFHEDLDQLFHSNPNDKAVFLDQDISGPYFGWSQSSFRKDITKW